METINDTNANNTATTHVMPIGRTEEELNASYRGRYILALLQYARGLWDTATPLREEFPSREQIGQGMAWLRFHQDALHCIEGVEAHGWVTLPMLPARRDGSARRDWTPRDGSARRDWTPRDLERAGFPSKGGSVAEEFKRFWDGCLKLDEEE